MDALVRPYRSEDLGQVVGLWESAGEAWPGLDVSMRLLLDAGAVCVVAETHGRVVGCGLGVVAGGVGWIWRTDAQRAFEREHFAGEGSRATTADFLAAIAETRATLTPATVEEFAADTTRFSRA